MFEKLLWNKQFIQTRNIDDEKSNFLLYFLLIIPFLILNILYLKLRLISDVIYTIPYPQRSLKIGRVFYNMVKTLHFSFSSEGVKYNGLYLTTIYNNKQ